MGENILIPSILTSIKKLLGIEDGYDHFDPELVMHINAAFQTLDELGVGFIERPFMITGKSEKWEDFFKMIESVEPEDSSISPIIHNLENGKSLQAVKTYIWIRVKLVFDPPSSSYAMTALQDQAKELEWRLLVQAERRKNN